MKKNTEIKLNKKANQIFAFLLALLLSVSFIACVKKENNPQSTDSETSEGGDTSDPYLALPTENYNDYTFNVLIRDENWIVADMFQEEPSSDVVQSAIYDRNRKIEDRYSIKLNSIPQNDGFTAIDSIFAGDSDMT